MGSVWLRHQRNLFDAQAHESSETVHQVIGGGRTRCIDALIISPGSVNDEVAIFHLNKLMYPSGISLVSVEITLPGDAAYSMVFEEWSGDPPTADNDIATVTTFGGDSYKEVLAAFMNDDTVAADAYIYLHIPATALDWIHVKVIYIPITIAFQQELGIAVKQVYSFYQSNVVANQTTVQLDVLSLAGNSEFLQPYNGSILAIAVASNDGRTAGTLTADVTVNGAATGLQAVLDGDNTTYSSTTQLIDLDTFVAGDRLGVEITTDAGWLPTTADIVVSVTIET